MLKAHTQFANEHMARSKTLYSLSGRLGVTEHMDTNTTDSVSEDSDGNPTEYQYVVDISGLLSEQLGKQMSMMSTYRVKGIQMSLRNVDDANDNNYGLAVGGRIRWYSPTQHRIDALQHARDFKRSLTPVLHSDVDDPFGAWQDDKKYTGMRFNWHEDADGVHGALSDDTNVLAGTDFSMKEIFEHYNFAIGGYPAEEGYDSSGGTGDALWNTRTGTLETDTLYWNTYYRNSAYQDGSGFENAFLFQPETGPWEFQCPANTHLSVLGGLMTFSVMHTNTDNPRSGDVNDDYYLHCSIQVEGWSDF